MSSHGLFVVALLGALLLVSTSACSPETGGTPGDGDADTDVDSDTDVDADSDADGDASTPPGGTCGCDSDCQAVNGQAGICVMGVCMIQPTATCSAAGSTAECPAGLRCWGVSGWDGSICWPDCASFSCAGECDGDGSCAGTAATNGGCNASCATLCSGGGGDGDADADSDADSDADADGDGAVGDPCGGDGDCTGGGSCYEDEDGGWVGGYCLIFGCSSEGAACGTNGICVAGLTSDDTLVCMRDCDAGCRDGYDCLVAREGGPGFCYPYCEGRADCPAGHQCVDEVCVPGEDCSPSAPDGLCPAGQTCVSGECEDDCSASAPDGYCPEGFECDGGRCNSTSGCGSYVYTGSGRYTLSPMPGSRDPRSADARAAGYYIATEERYSFLRNDIIQVIQWASCEMRTRWPDVAPLGLTDMSTDAGVTPGCERGDDYCRHPSSTHRGDDIDTAYYQTDGDNDPQIICGDGSDTNYNGRAGRYNDGYFCTTEDNIVNIEQERHYLSLLDMCGFLRVVGIDETLADDLRGAGPLGYGESGGWAFHHHHTHISFSR